MPLPAAPLAYLVLTSAGKPVFYSTGSEQSAAEYMAVFQAITACFEGGPQLTEVRSATAQFVLAPVELPLVLVAVDKQKRSPRVLRAHLNLLAAQILSVLTKQQLERQLELRPQTDIRPLLTGTEVFLKALASSFEECAPWSWLNALEALPMKRRVRAALNSALLAAKEDTGLLYALVLTKSLLAGVARPRQHSLHPPDLHLLVSMLFNTNKFTEGEHWAPICFPKFNPNGFLYAYIRPLPNAGFLVLVSPSRHGFFEMQGVAQKVLANLEAEPKVLEALQQCERLEPSILGIEPIKYFIFKGRAEVQFVQSALPAGEGADLHQIRLMFVQMQAEMDALNQRVRYVRLASSSFLAWQTPSFELYCYTESTDKEAVSAAARRLVAWARRREGRLFVVDGATF